MHTQESAKMPYGRMAHVAKDQLHILEPGHLFTSPCLSTRITFRFYVLVLVCADGGEVTVTSSKGSVTAQAIVARPSTEWHIETEGTQLVTLLVNPLHPLFPRFRKITAPGAMAMPLEPYLSQQEAMKAAYRGELDVPGALALFEEMVRISAEMLPPRRERPLRWQTELDAWLIDPSDSLDVLADKVGVSSDRMSTLFQDAVGLPMRSYLLWRKTHRIAELFSEGLSLTEIAHAAGFTDSAHMCHMFQDVFGAPPTHFLRNDLVRVQAWLGHPAEKTQARMVA
jgi:AraC family transcriptional regulator of arabinose operon